MFTVNDIFELPVSREVIEKTLRNTVKKFNFTCRALMYSRTPVELLDNLYMGDMAKNALYDYLVKHCNCPVIDYDEVRTDNFQNHDPGWDLLVGNKKIKVEIKSSIPPKNESREDIVRLRDIKITASHDEGRTWINPNDLESDIHVQVYFYAKAYKNGYNSFQELSALISKDMWKVREIINSDKYNSPLFFGYNTKENIIKHLESLPRERRTWTFSWTHRIYWKCPIIDAFNMSSLIALIDDKQNVYHPQIAISTIFDSVEQSEEFSSYLPIYSIKAACGYFGEGEPLEEQGWIKAEGIGRLNRNMFVVRAVGHSMEPRINDGDYCVFQANPAGSRQGTIVLAQHRGYFDEDNAGAYSIKEYHSQKSFDEDGNWQHEQIVLKPLNRAYEPITLTPDDIADFRIVGGFVGVLQVETPQPKEEPSAPQPHHGFCIRCGKEIEYSFGQDKPKFYCKDCWLEWYRTGHDTKHKEKYCHRCGTAHPATAEKPICWAKCWQEVKK